MSLRRNWGITGAALLAATCASADVCIDNDVPEGTVGHWEVCLWEGGYSDWGNLTATRQASQDVATENVIYDWRTYIDPGAPGGTDVFNLEDYSGEVWTDSEDPDKAHFTGYFYGASDQRIDWEMVCSIPDGGSVMTCALTFTTQSTAGLGPLFVLQYLDEDVEGSSDDVFQARGSAQGGDLELLTVDDAQVYGVSQGGATSTQQGLVNSVFAGWAADEYDEIQDRLGSGTAQPVSTSGVILNLDGYSHPFLGPSHGPADVVTAMGWIVSPTAGTATVISTLGGVPQPPEPGGDCVPGDISPPEGDGVVDLRDLVSAVHVVLGKEELCDRARRCSDVHPGALLCSWPPTWWMRPDGWCPEGDGEIRLGDVIVIFRTILGRWTIDCHACDEGSVRARTDASAACRPGDVQRDGLVDVSDVVKALRLSVGLEEATDDDVLRSDVAPGLLEADGTFTASPDGTVGVADVVALLRTAVGLQRLQWPVRTLSVRLTPESATTSRMVRVGGWPAWAEAAGITSTLCDGLTIADGGTWGWACVSDSAALTAEETVVFSYRAGRSVEPASLRIDATATTPDLAQVPLAATVMP